MGRNKAIEQLKRDMRSQGLLPRSMREVATHFRKTGEILPPYDQRPPESVVGKTAKPAAYEHITTCEAESLQEAFTYLNRKLFDGKLPDVFLRYVTKANSDGFYTPNGFSGRAAKFGRDAITLNSSRFVGRSDKQILGVLGHQMTHHRQYHFGTKPHRHYHDDEWSQKSIEIGFQPPSTGDVGGKITGQRMSQYIIPGGRFEQVCDELIATGWKLNLESAHRPGTVKVKNDSKTTFLCPKCRQQFYGKPHAASALKYMSGIMEAVFKSNQGPNYSNKRIYIKFGVPY